MMGGLTSGSFTVVWTREMILDAIRDWHAAKGEPPKVRQWQKSSDDHPTVPTVITRFGSWNRAIAEAGFEPRPRGGNIWPEERVVRHRRNRQMVTGRGFDDRHVGAIQHFPK